MTTEDIVKNYVFLTAGACGPCRFGMYVTEYRKALRDAGFDGFRVMLFQQTGGLKQATGEERRPGAGPAVLHRDHQGAVRRRRDQRASATASAPTRSSRARPTARSRRSKNGLYEALAEAHERDPGAAPRRARSSSQVKVDRTLRQAQGQHHRRVLGDDHRGRRQLPAAEVPRERGRRERHPAPRVLAPLQHLGVPPRHAKTACACEDVDDAQVRPRRLATLGADACAGLWVGEIALRSVFQTFAHAVGLYGYHLPDMDEVAEGRPQPLQPTICAAAKATWKSAS